ncbi:MAG TPA: hypothetical protein VE864_03960 [Streptosporangiaceae bacterium]|nr:hypothetical protein [Streptosporangiaceae bacterium]
MRKLQRAAVTAALAVADLGAAGAATATTAAPRAGARSSGTVSTSTA